MPFDTGPDGTVLQSDPKLVLNVIKVITSPTLTLALTLILTLTLTLTLITSLTIPSTLIL